MTCGSNDLQGGIGLHWIILSSKQHYSVAASITASALSRDTRLVRAGSGVKGDPRQRGVISTVDAADGSPSWNAGTEARAVDWTSSLAGIFRLVSTNKPSLPLRRSRRRYLISVPTGVFRAENSAAAVKIGAKALCFQ